MDCYNPSLVLVKPRKTRPCLTERLLIGRKESNQTNKQIFAWWAWWFTCLPQLLKEKVDGKARVAANKRVIDSLTKYMDETLK